jgi:plasmid maintenance system killer protein
MLMPRLVFRDRAGFVIPGTEESNRLHALKEDRKGQHSISINMEYRICFRWTAAGAEDVEVTDYH